MSKRLEHVVVVACGRSAIARSGKKGALRNMHPVDMGGLVLKGILERDLPNLPKELIEDVIVGCAQPDLKQGCNPARAIAIRAGLPYCVPGVQINRFCSSGLQAVAMAAAQIESGMNEILVAGGIESMTAVPANYDRTEFFDPWILDNEPGVYLPMGITAENVAEKYNISREEMDAFAVESHRKAAAARAAGKFKDEIIPLEGVDADGNAIIFDQDQGIRENSDMETLAKLNPCFLEGGKVTAATSSQTSDGAAFVVLMSDTKAAELGIKPIARFIGFAAVGCDPAYMGEGPMYAVPKVMELTGMSVDEMDVIELNEAFAAQAIPCIRKLGLDPAKVNPNGGAIAMGHPMGATGAFLTCKALNELKRTGGKYALVTMCIGHGMGAAGIYEMCGEMKK